MEEAVDAAVVTGAQLRQRGGQSMLTLMNPSSPVAPGNPSSTLPSLCLNTSPFGGAGTPLQYAAFVVTVELSVEVTLVDTDEVAVPEALLESGDVTGIDIVDVTGTLADDRA